MAESGYTVEVLDDESILIEARYLAEASDDGTDDRCYHTEFKDVDESWQIAHQDKRADGALLDACLRDNGLDVPKTRKEKVDALVLAGVDLGSCLGKESMQERHPAAPAPLGRTAVDRGIDGILLSVMGVLT
ncbi:hypothetical protein ACEXQE_04770 [Herbiconiux sp. P17]|uniref:hypothetical protein n=1 Tax=Herbiconiux wuyangfengii TaxID=3342794 RepID=UPI0035B6B1DE